MGAIFVDDNEYRKHRLRESEQALGLLGVARTDQHYLGLPDSSLALSKHTASIATAIAHIVRRDSVNALVTLGEHGYCGHTDHAASHRAAALALHILAIHRYRPPVFSLNQRGEGSIQIPVDRNKKLGALAFHRTQMHFIQGDDGKLVPEPMFFTRFQKTYGKLFTAETYDILPGISRLGSRAA